MYAEDSCPPPAELAKKQALEELGAPDLDYEADPSTRENSEPDRDDERSMTALGPNRNLAAVWRAIHKIERQQVTQQDEVNALAAKAGEIGTDLAAAKTTLQAEIDALGTANPALDLTGLTAAVGPLDQAAKDLAGLTPTPTPTPAAEAPVPAAEVPVPGGAEFPA